MKSLSIILVAVAILSTSCNEEQTCVTCTDSLGGTVAVQCYDSERKAKRNISRLEEEHSFLVSGVEFNAICSVN